jgi:hypothetical protein
MPRPAARDGDAGKVALPLIDVSWPTSWASAADNDDEEGEEDMFSHMPLASKTVNDVAIVVKVDDKEVTGERDGWQEVMPWPRSRRPALPASPTSRYPITAWLKGICWRCLAPNHRVVVCSD